MTFFEVFDKRGRYAAVALLFLALLPAGCSSVDKNARTSDSSLLKAVRRDDPAAFDKALAAGEDLNAADNRGRTPLMIAAGDGRKLLVERLLKAGANVGAVDDKRQTALHYAAASDAADIVKDLLAAGADPSAKNDYGWTPLVEAARLGCTETVEELTKGGADLNLADKQGKTPLMHAASSSRNSATIVKILLDAGADPEPKDCEKLNAMMWAIQGGNSDAALLTLSKMASLENDRAVGLITMQWAIKTGNKKMVETLADKGVPLNLETSDFTRITRTLQMNGISKVFANYELMSENRTPLMWAAIYGQPGIAALLISRGSEVNARDNKGHTAFDYAKDLPTSRIIKAAGGS